MGTLSPPDPTGTAEPETSNKPASYRDAQVWKDIQAETGFASYWEYLSFYDDIFIRSDVCRRWFLDLPPQNRDPLDRQRQKIAIYDIEVPENSPTSLRLRGYCCSGTELIQGLRNPPDNVCVQIVLFPHHQSFVTREMMEAFILGLKMRVHEVFRLQGWSPAPKNIGGQIRSIYGRQVMATISQDFMRDTVNLVPVVLVTASEGDQWKANLWKGNWWHMLNVDPNADSNGSFPLLKTPRADMSFKGKLKRSDSLQSAGLLYANAVGHFMAQAQDSQYSCVCRKRPFLLLAALTPLLYAQANDLIIKLNSFHDLHARAINGNRDQQKKLDNERPFLRRSVEQTEDIMSQFSRYIATGGHPELSTETPYSSLLAELKSVIADARRLDAEIRDFQQLQVGNLALEESRRSIKLSNAQIREARSGEFS